jgi:integrase
VLRYRFQGRDREMGLGGEYVSLKEARHSAAQARRQIREGLDPIEERRKARGKSSAPTFAKCAKQFINDNQVAWGSAKHRAQWRNTLGSYVFPVLGDKPVDTIDVDDVLRVLTPLWTLRPETASRVRGRIERVLDWARARGLRHGENPARWRGHLDNLLPKRSKVRAVRHFAALPWRGVPAFMTALRAREGVAERALEFAVLTAARSGEVRGMRWDEVDGDVWAIPAERIKAKQEHRVPLSPRALVILDELPRFDGAELVFPGMRPGRPLNDMTLGAVLKRMGHSDLTVHGFRSTFRDWSAESTNFTREVCEQALAHTLVDKTEAAYRRGDLLEKRRRLMNAWAVYCGQSPRAKVVEFSA